MTVLDPFFRRSIRTSHPFRREGRRKAESVSTAALPDGPNTLLKLYGNPVPQNIASLTSLVSRRRRRQREKTQEMKLRRKSMQKREREERDWTPQRRAEIGSGHPSRQIGEEEVHVRGIASSISYKWIFTQTTASPSFHLQSAR